MSSQETHIDGDAGSVLSGSFSGAVTIASGPDVDQLAEQLLAKHGPVRAEMAVSLGTQQRLLELEARLERRFLDDELQRVWRQRETDLHRQEVTNALRAINDQLAALAPRITRSEATAGRAAIAATVALLAAVGVWVRGRR